MMQSLFCTMTQSGLFRAISVLTWLLIAGNTASTFGQNGCVHGLWIWKTSEVLKAPGSAEALRTFCKSNGINEVYISMSSKGSMLEDGTLNNLITLLHRSKIRVEALFGSADGDMPGKPRDKLLDQVREIVRSNQKHPKQKFDGIHLDIEPHQRDENKGADNLTFLPSLIETYSAVRALTDPAKMTLNADIANKFLKGDLSQRKMLLTSVPRVTLMLYELSSPDDGKSPESKVDKVRTFSARYFAMAYSGLNDRRLAAMSIALRTPDYLDALPIMLHALDETHSSNPRYLGWAVHSYNDVLGATR